MFKSIKILASIFYWRFIAKPFYCDYYVHRRTWWSYDSEKQYKFAYWLTLQDFDTVFYDTLIHALDISGAKYEIIDYGDIDNRMLLVANNDWHMTMKLCLRDEWTAFTTHRFLRKYNTREDYDANHRQVESTI